jgi:hypothetical protein
VEKAGVKAGTSPISALIESGNMRTIWRRAIFCTVGVLAFAPASDAQIVMGVNVVRGGEPSEVAGSVGLSSFRHLLAIEYSRLRDEEAGSGCSTSARYEFTPRKIYDQAADRIRRVSAFAVGSIGLVRDSCTSGPSNEEKPAAGLARNFNARADAGGGVRILLFDVPGGFGGLLRVAVTALGLSVGFDLLTTVFLGKLD